MLKLLKEPLSFQTSSLYAFSLGCSAWKFLFTCWMIRSASPNTFRPLMPISLASFKPNIKASYSAMLFVTWKVNLKDKWMHYCVGDTRTTPALTASLEQAPSKNMSQICGPSSSALWKTGFLSCVEANWDSLIWRIHAPKSVSTT